MKKIYSFKESYTFSEILKKGREILEKNGYHFLRLPSFDTDTLKRKFISVLNTRDDEVIFLRSDFTYQIIKHFDSISDIDLPLRIYYEGNLFDPDFEDFEIYQIGFELIGVEDIEGDFEIIYCLYEIFKSININDFILVISNPSFIEKVISARNIDRNKVENLLKKKNIGRLRKEFGNGSFIEKLIFMQGKREIIDEALCEFPEGEEELIKINKLIDKLEQNNISHYIIDLSDIKRLPYYNGITFEIFMENSGYAVASGGRYDGIYREGIPATGGAVYVDNIIKLMK